MVGLFASRKISNMLLEIVNRAYINIYYYIEIMRDNVWAGKQSFFIKLMLMISVREINMHYY